MDAPCQERKKLMALRKGLWYNVHKSIRQERPMSKYSFPKVDLHLHLDGSMLPESAWEMAAERGIRLPAATLEVTCAEDRA